jgi:hypothetical protein
MRKAKQNLIKEVDNLDKLVESKELSIQEECRKIAKYLWTRFIE